VVVEGFKEVRQAFQTTGNVRKRRQNGLFSALIDLKIINAGKEI
jgi:hypothetical protein